MAKLPNDEYVAFFTATWNKFGEDQLSAHKAACPANTACVSSQQEAQLSAQIRIATGLVAAKNNWAKAGKSDADQKTAEENFNKCAKENKDCDKLPENERNIANDARGNTTPVVVVTPGGVTADISAGEKKVADEIKALEDAFNAAHEGWLDKELTAEGKDHLLNILNTRLEKNLAMLAELCKKYPENKDVCLSEDQIKQRREATAGGACLVERSFAKKGTTFTNHEKEWTDLPAPKSCQTLLDLDKKAPVVVVPDDPQDVPVEEEGDDEKSPRNYKAETCKWVTDLPRKVVNGPSCGKTRSNICTGYVICEQKEGGGKFIRMSTCGPKHCGSSDADAVACTKDQGYYSKKPASETKLFMSSKLKKILSGSSEQ